MGMHFALAVASMNLLQMQQLAVDTLKLSSAMFVIIEAVVVVVVGAQHNWSIMYYHLTAVPAAVQQTDVLNCGLQRKLTATAWTGVWSSTHVRAEGELVLT
jgi:hypothetical protein